jgi:hypothetical protein
MKEIVAIRIVGCMVRPGMDVGEKAPAVSIIAKVKKIAECRFLNKC